MTNDSNEQSLTSKILKVLRITNEPLSAHAINEIYGFGYAKVRAVLKNLEEDGLIISIKTDRGRFYFIPDRYLKRTKDMLDSDQPIPAVWYEDLSVTELQKRKETLSSQIKNSKVDFQKKKIAAKDYFSKIQEKNEEIAIINQILEDKLEKLSLECLYCNEVVDKSDEICPHCNSKIPTCSVCKRKIYAEQKAVKCSHCEHLAHKSHIIEWIKSFGYCPNCKKPLIDTDLIELQELYSDEK